MIVWVLAAAAAVLVFDGGGGGGGGGGASVVPRVGVGGVVMTRKQDLIRYLSAAGLDPAWRDFFVFVAAGESGFRTTARNDSSSEARAAARGYRKNKDRLSVCGHPAVLYSWGSGGWFGMLPTTAIFSLPRGLRCHDPVTAVFDPSLSVAAAVGMARSLSQRPHYRGTVLSMRAGWGWPAKIGDPERLRERRPVYVLRAEKLGLPASYVDSALPPLSLTSQDALNGLARAGLYVPTGGVA